VCVCVCVCVCFVNVVVLGNVETGLTTMTQSTDRVDHYYQLPILVEFLYCILLLGHWFGCSGLLLISCCGCRHIFPSITAVLFGQTSGSVAGTGATGQSASTTGAAKAEVRVAAAEALKALQQIALRCPQRDKLWTWVTDYKQQEEIKRITSVT
jgi:hypothetical protein